MPLLNRLRRKPAGNPADPKPIHVRIVATDGQWLEINLGPGDAIGFAGIRVDAKTNDRIELTHYTPTES